MTANLVVQVSMEPKLVAVALEHESVTARLVRAGEAFSLTVLARADRDVVRRFVKPVVDVERAADGTVTSMSGQPVEEVGPGRLPVLASRAADAALPPRAGRRVGQPRPLHRRGDRGGRRTGGDRGPPHGGHPHALRRLGLPRSSPTPSAAPRPGRLRPQVDAQGQDAVDQLGLGVADHGEVGEVALGLLAKAHPLGALDRRHAPRPHRLGPLLEAHDHFLGIESRRHGAQRRCWNGAHE